MTSTRARDEGLRRVSSITRWVAAMGVAATGFLAAFVYRSSPGRATVSSTPAGAATTTGSAASSAAPVDPNAGSGFQAPAVAPTPVYQVPVVRSGAS